MRPLSPHVDPYIAVPSYVTSISTSPPINNVAPFPVGQIRANGVGGLGLGLGATDVPDPTSPLVVPNAPNPPPRASAGAGAETEAVAGGAGGLENDDSDGGSTCGRDEKDPAGDRQTAPAVAPALATAGLQTSKAASRARRRGQGHGKRPSAWDVIPSLANDGQVQPHPSPAEPLVPLPLTHLSPAN